METILDVPVRPSRYAGAGAVQQDDHITCARLVIIRVNRRDGPVTDHVTESASEFPNALLTNDTQ